MDGGSEATGFFLSPPLFSLPVGVLLASKRCNRQQLEAGVPALQQSLSVASQGLAMCTDVQQTLLEW